MISRYPALLAALLLVCASPAWALATAWGGQFIEGTVAQPRTANIVFTINARVPVEDEQRPSAPTFDRYPDNDFSDEIQKTLGLHDGQMQFYTARFEQSGSSAFTVGADQNGLRLKAAW